MTTKLMKRSTNGTRDKEKSAKFQRAFEKNWENCQEKYKAWQQDSRYRFTVQQMKEMGEIAQEDFATALWVYREGESKTRAANEAQMPYYLFDYMLKKHEKEQERELENRVKRDVFSKLRTGREEMTEIERMKRLRLALITEMEERVATDKHRHDITNSELVSMNKMLAATETSLEMGTTGGEDEGVEFTVITHMPKKEYEDEPEEEEDEDDSVH